MTCVYCDPTRRVCHCAPGQWPTDSRCPTHRTNGGQDMAQWWGLSYAAWLTLPRVLMGAMPDDWQKRMAELLQEYNAAYPNQPDLGTVVQQPPRGGW